MLSLSALLIVFVGAFSALAAHFNSQPQPAHLLKCRAVAKPAPLLTFLHVGALIPHIYKKGARGVLFGVTPRTTRI
ncbi:hypothetical protein DXG82_15730 [Salmonella enterica]|nr:hypothetical protein [Salmonella enterica subsp. diarizonae]EBM3224335.1 hypothetical protein [Salmonella enterica]